MAEQEFYRIAPVFTDGTDDLLRCFLGAVVDTDDAVLLLAEEGSLRPADAVGDPVLQKGALNQPLAFQIAYLTEFNLVVDFYVSE